MNNIDDFPTAVGVFPEDSEQKVIKAMRAHKGGLGQPLSEKQKDEIIYGRKNDPENPEPVNGERAHEGFLNAIRNHPVEWFLERSE